MKLNCDPQLPRYTPVNHTVGSAGVQNEFQSAQVIDASRNFDQKVMDQLERNFTGGDWPILNGLKRSLETQQAECT